MCGNGARIGIMTATTGLHQTAAPGFRLRAVPVFCGAGRGTTARASAGLPTASGPALTTATPSAAVFVCAPVLNSEY